MIAIGTQNKLSLTVTLADTAVTFKSGSLPVLATPRLIALCEEAACQLIESTLENQQTTVGTLINVQHLAASPIGQTVTVTCTLIAHKDRKFQFAIEAIDAQQVVAQGYHERVLVDADKFMKKISDK
ncbi:thioesterase family protein [Periweissella fabalis]|uniref:Thioesterase family protein n=1 Tax=Periweissella fabalis TaxID=1070421 RepID=A0A7X6S2P8_9LACO|nr:thioesterase family protein [Periweissella fabalis]MCM0599051.1 thioesterase family protein [Periweissella fabalis]NKZ23331.1 thioesterase family protein [Periweissella fabalis]